MERTIISIAFIALTAVLLGIVLFTNNHEAFAQILTPSFTLLGGVSGYWFAANNNGGK